MKTLAERLDEEERIADERDALRKTIKEALERGRKDAEAMQRATHGMFGHIGDCSRLILY